MTHEELKPTDKICMPMLLMKAMTFADNKCIGEKCSLFSTSTQACGILAISESMGYIADKIDMIRNDAISVRIISR